MELIDRCQHFLDELGFPATVLSRKIGISSQALYEWRRGNLNLADSTLQRIDEYLKKYNF